MKKSVLFICTGNSARSQMAEAILKNQAGEFFEVFSAGTTPQNIEPHALNLMRQFKLPISQVNAKPLTEFQNKLFDFVIVLCNKAKKNYNLRQFHFDNEIIFWNFEDPKDRQCVNPYETTFKELNERIKMFVLVQTKSLRMAV